MSLVDKYADTELKKEIKEHLIALKVQEDAILGALIAFEEEWQWQRLKDFLDTGITDTDIIEDKISEIHEELYPDEDEE